MKKFGRRFQKALPLVLLTTLATIHAVAGTGCHQGGAQGIVPGTPAAPTAVLATAGEALVSLAWLAPGGATSFNVKRSTTAGGPYSTFAVTTTPNHTATGLVNGTLYYFVVSAANAVGEGPVSVEVSGQPAQPPTAPAAPTGLSTPAIPGDAQVGLSWNASPGAASYDVQRSTTSGGPYTTIAAGVVETSYLDTAVSNGTTYYYVILAVNSVGTSAASAQVSSAPTAPAAPPAAPTGLTADAGDGEVTLNWNASAGATGYNVRRRTFTTSWSTVGSVGGSPYQVYFVFSDGTAANATVYTYAVTAVNSAGSSADSNEVSATPTAPASPPAAPRGFTASAGNARVTVSWNRSSGASRYRVRRGTSTGGPYPTTFTGISGTTFTDMTAANGTTYFYVAAGDNSAGTGPDSNEASATPTAPPPAPPTPANLVATPGNQPQIALTWNASAGATSYTVGRSTVSGGPFPVIASPTTNSYTDTSAANNTAYYYVARALNVGGQSAPTAEVSATTPTLPPTGLAATPENTPRVVLNWGAAAGSANYTVKRGAVPGTYTTTFTGVAGTTYTDTTAANGTLYYYAVAANNAGGPSRDSNEVAALVPPAPPTVTFTTNNTPPRVDLSWGAIFGAASYSVKRGTSSGGSYTTVASPTATSYADTAVANNTPYFYVVTAVNASGESLASAEVAPIVPPGAPTLTAAVSFNTPRVDLTWAAPPGGAPSYTVLRGVTGVFTGPGLSGGDSAAGMADNATFTYSVVATNPGGSSVSSNTITVTTPPAPPTGISATPTNAPSVTVNWTASAGATSYKIQRSVNGGPYDTNYASTAVTSFAEVGFAVSGNTSYSYFIVASSAAGDSRLPTAVNAVTPPAAPTGLAASATNAPQVALSWTASTGATGYNIKRQVGGAGAFSQYATSATNSYTDLGVADNTSYAYQIAAVNASPVESQLSNTASLTTPPEPPVLATPTFTIAPSVVLGWTPITPITSYTVLRGTVTGAYTTTVPGLVTTGHTDSTVATNTTYFYAVAAVNASGTSRPSNERSALTLPAPATLDTASTTNTPSASLSWTAPASGSPNFRVMRAIGAGSFSQIAVVTTTSFIDITGGMADNTQFSYRIVTNNATGDGGNSNTLVLTTPPAPPTLSLLGVTTAPRVDHGWTAVAGASSYTLLRGTSPGILTTTFPGISGIGFNDASVATNTQYYYAVVSVNANGTSRRSNETSPLTRPGPAALNSATATNAPSVNLGWAAPVNGSPNYRVMRRVSGPGAFSQVGGLVTGTTTTDATAASNTSYDYQIVATNATGDGLASNVLSRTTPPAAPTGLTPTAGFSQIQLSWNSSAGASSYTVARSAALAGPYGDVATGVTTTFFTDNSPLATNFYVVRAVNGSLPPGERTSQDSAPAGPVSPNPALPNPPTLNSATPGDATVGLSWTAPASGPAPANYRVMRSTTSGSGYVDVSGLLPTSPTTFTNNTGLTNGTAYFYVVRSVNGSGDSVNSNELSATPNQPPGVPTGVFASLSGNSPQITVTWNAGTGGIPATYTVKRSTNGGSFTTIANVGAPTTTFDDTAGSGLTFNSDNQYVVSATNSISTSADSAPSGLIPTPPGSPVSVAATVLSSPVRIQVGWNAPASGGATSYKVLRQTNGAGPFTQIAGGVASPYIDGPTGLTQSTMYSYQVVATGAGGDGPASAPSAPVTTPGPPPGPVTLSGTPADTAVNLNWTGGSGATSFDVFRATAATGPFIPIMSLPGNQFSTTDTGRTNGVPLWYQVDGTNPGGSAMSNIVGPITPTPGPSIVSTNIPTSPFRVQRGFSLSVTWSMAMDPATFVSGGGSPTVTIGSSPTDAGLASMAVPLLFYWDTSFTLLTVVLDTRLPVGIFGDDILADNTTYTVTFRGGASGVKSSSGTGSMPLAADDPRALTTTLDATPPTLLSTTPTLNDPVTGASGSTIQMTWSEPMLKRGTVSIRQDLKNVELAGTSAPTTAPLGSVSSGGSVTVGTHSYVYTFVVDGTESGVSPASLVITTTSGNQQVNLSGIATGPFNTSERRIYRTAAGDVLPYRLVGTISNPSVTVFSDTVADDPGGAVPTVGGLTLSWNAPGDVLTVTLNSALPGDTYRLGLENFNDLSNNFFESRDDRIFVVPLPGDLIAPTVTLMGRPAGTPEVRDAGIAIFFSEPMWPADLLDSMKITVTTNVGSLPTLEKELIDIPGVFFVPRRAWPANATITVTAKGGVGGLRDASGNTLAADRVFVLTTDAGDTSAPVLDEPFSTLSATSSLNVEINNPRNTLAFRSTAIPANRLQLNRESLLPRDVQIVELRGALPPIPLKGFQARIEDGSSLEIDGRMDFAGMTRGADHELIIHPTFQTSMGAPLSASPYTIQFTTTPTGGNSRPSFTGGGETRYSTTTAGVRVELSIGAFDSDSSTTLAASAKDMVNQTFNPTLSGGGFFDYSTSGPGESALTTPGARSVRYTVTDSPGSHTVNIDTKAFVFNTSLFPTLSISAGPTPNRPKYDWTTTTLGSLGADIGVIVVSRQTGPTTFVPVYASAVDLSTGTFTQPEDQRLQGGGPGVNYAFALMFMKFMDGGQSEAETDRSGTVLVP